MKIKIYTRKIIALCLVATILFLYSCSKTVSQPLDEGVKVTVMDVGQGDSIFIQLPDSRCMLIDAGESEYGERVVDYIENSGYNKIDYLVATHPHADHIGGMRTVINAFDIGNVYMPKASTNTSTFERMLELIDEKGLQITTAKAGVNILSEENLCIDILAPNSDSYSELNDYSAVIKLTYGNSKFLFMGDAEENSEDEIMADVSADFVKVGHHGSKTSSGEDFVRRVGASYAAVSVGEDNDYNLPVDYIIDRWEESGAKVLMTKDVGNIIAESDGVNLTVNGETLESSGSSPSSTSSTSSSSGESDGYWILNTNTKRIHRPDCYLADNIADKNRDESTDSISELENKGYKPCGSCKPQD